MVPNSPPPSTPNEMEESGESLSGWWDEPALEDDECVCVRGDLHMCGLWSSDPLFMFSAYLTLDHLSVAAVVNLGLVRS